MDIKDKSVEVSKHANVALGSNSTYNVVNAGLESFPTVSRAHGIHSPASENERPNPAGNTLEDVVNVLVWVKLHCVFVTAFSEDGLSSIATNLGTLLMLDVTPPDGVWTEYVSEGVTSS
ncbi:hypothetical protein Tco_1295877 [Tanacetum coccineum]